MDSHSSTSSQSTPAVSAVGQLRSQSLSELWKAGLISDLHYKPSPFSMQWINGYNPKVPVLNLNRGGSTALFYAAVNCGVVYNWTSNQMRILQGHKHVVTNIASDADGKWLVTADYGPENIITIWDTVNYFPYKTLFSPHHGVKVSKLTLSADAKYLLTLGYSEKTIIYWWIWSHGWDQPHALLEVDLPQNSVLAMSFNPEDTTQFALMTKNDVWIGISRKIVVLERGVLKETDDYELKLRKIEKNINPEYGRLTCFTFVANTSQILAGTSRGSVVVYGYTIEFQENVEHTDYQTMKFVKVLRVEKNRINVIVSVDNVIVTGNSVGRIRFYDEQLRLVYWAHGFSADSVRGLSFNLAARSYEVLDPACNKKCPCWEEVQKQVDPLTGRTHQVLIKKKLPTSATATIKEFLVRDFVVTTQNQGIGFVDFVTEKLTTIVNCKPAVATAITVHPEKPFLCLGYSDGVVELYNFENHSVFSRLDLRDRYKEVTPPDDDSITGNYQVNVPTLSVACVKFAPSGLHLSCGLNTGAVLFLDPSTLTILTTPPFRDTEHAIKQLNYSVDSLTMAFSDVGKTVGVYKYDCESHFWFFVGKHRSHYKDISSVFFTPKKNKGVEYKLLSLGHDRALVEYDIAASNEEYLEIYSLDRIDQAAVPLCAINWPNPKDLDPETHNCDVPMMLIATDEHKYKIVNYDTTMTLATVLGPRYEQPVCKMEYVETKDGKYLVFATKNIIGLQKMPLDGNPWKHVGVLGHPVQITEMCFRADLGYLFTIGAKDSCMIQWSAKFGSVDITSKNGGEDLDPYYCLIEGGRPGWLFQEIRDLFYYIQILCQGTFSPAIRKVNDFIPVDSLPDLMRALGFFPSEYEIENILVEAKYKVHQKEPSVELDFEEFVKLYLNHRPAFGDNYARLRAAFRNFSSFQNEKHFMYREDFVDMLGHYGECFPVSLTWYLLSVLSGHSFEDREQLVDEDFSFLPEVITFNEFANTILGISDSDHMDQFSLMESVGSQLTASSATSQSYGND